ncbi:rab-GTPase-TBC domain-containing protein [Chaetomidium leptoderma]|uniref:Rab-GTPase-TBC domain-containing protein n=1 Tax=Chaetomidium leptoderma TaxID=669021 RepID=A0AAN6VTG8_9PEZI|nr:rab-GTPase-TBC domain-containing protein [Chaetomidium leptoderma]
MEADRDGGDTPQVPASADPVQPASDGALEQTNSPPIATETDIKTSDHDSLVTVRLSEPPSLHLNTAVPPSTILTRKSPVPDRAGSDAVAETVDEGDDDDSESEIFEPASKSRPNLLQELGQAGTDSTNENGEGRKLRDSCSSSGSERVDWEELQKKEDLESKGENSGNPTASLLAKLEQENDRIATNQKSTKVKADKKRRSRESRPRPPSMAQLRKMVSGPTPPALRYSTLPPPAMTELEFYLALVKDPKQTAARLPTLLSNKVRKGVPPPLRGVVWQSMAGARDSALEEVFERLSGESSPYEGVINKDLGRSFPGVDMFRDPEGDGQRMLGRVLKCFSLYDTKIGYCQGLAFLVGPLLMHMPDKQAFCVLVRLMENYDLRQCFVPDLSGLHIRIYQFRELLRQHLPTLTGHLDDLQVEPAYVSQWFLSFYAVTCPLPMLFRIYDVIFAEGASATIMRVALSLMRKNQARILACTEFEDVMHLLLSRGVWDCYNHNADEFVQDFVALAGVVTKERLVALEQGYKEAKISPSANHRGGTEDAAQASADVTNAASRFLGRIWASSSTPRFATFTAAAQSSGPASVSNTLNPGTGAASRPISMLRRSTSKQSLSSMEAVSSTTSSAASVLSSVSTEATAISRDSSADDPPREATAPPSKTAPTAFSGSVNTSKDGSKYLHSQIEDLLTALSELQRNHALLASQLQREKEDREEDRGAVRSLLDGLRRKAGGEDEGDNTILSSAMESATAPGGSDAAKPTAQQLSDLLDVVEVRFSEAAASPRTSAPETKLQLRDELARAKEQLLQERAKSKEFDRRVQEVEQEMSSMREQLKESHAHVRNVHQEKQRLERQIHGMRIRASDTPASTTKGEWFPKAAASGGAAGAGLRELKLNRSRSTPSQAASMYSNKRASSLMMRKNDSSESLVPGGALPPGSSSSGPTPLTAPISEHDALLMDLVQAKTAEAVARQELEEAKQKLEQLRKAFGLAPGETPPVMHSGGATATSSAMGMFGRLTGSSTTPGVSESPSKVSTPPATSNTSSAGFWGWRR